MKATTVRTRTVGVIVVLMAFVAASVGLAPRFQTSGDAPRILRMTERDALQNRWLKERFDTILPALMRREQIDMWIVICREHNEDPVYRTLVPQPSMFAWRLTMFVYTDRGAAGIEKLTINRYGGGDLHKDFPQFYRAAWEPESLDPWARLARVVRERNPRRIAIDESKTFSFADGLTSTLKARLVEALGPELSSRLVSAEKLAVGWLEQRSAGELAFYEQIVALTHQVAAEAFSSAHITPGVTTIDDLEDFARERFAEMRVEPWFPPMFYITRPPSARPLTRVVQKGDMLRCDIGFTYAGLTSDIQELAYVLRDGETDAPNGLRDGLAAGNRLQDILVAHYKAGQTGNQVLRDALAAARAAGLVPKIYSHPLGFDGHAAGSRIGLPDMQDGVPGMGDHPLANDMVWAVELSVTASVAEWGGLEIQFPLEQDAAFTASGARFLDGRQTTFHLVRASSTR
jgi:Xaa-Pro aminopeptidase